MNILFLTLQILGSVLSIQHDYKGFDDTIIFSINWPGSPEALENLVDNKEVKPEVCKEFVLINHN